LVDSHVHLLSRQFNRDREQVIERAFVAGNEFLIEVAADVPTLEQVAKLPLSFKRIYTAVGVHPHDAKAVDGPFLTRLDRLADELGVAPARSASISTGPPRDVQKAFMSRRHREGKKFDHCPCGRHTARP
jgi:TatD DNase family protein